MVAENLDEQIVKACEELAIDAKLLQLAGVAPVISPLVLGEG